MTIRVLAVGTVFLYADRRTDRYHKAKCTFSQFCQRA